MARKTSELGRFTDVALLVLISLAEGQKHGYRMIHDIEKFSGTALEPGTLYGALMRLEERAWIEAVETAERRKPYRITERGREALREQLATLRRIEQAGARRTAIVWGTT
ncbi:PadR family transcriptional regulator [Nonomuraea sp. KC401]|uniref:PadR family transcriptional regulator n=1 Tax=unclassified Nonomuraea TaxID=2593643 RepID=UPI0010FCDC22|nr:MULTISPECIES: helix-turn-helix transcriptional regulator [unclassified Nonomuraea]NBE92888.1 PadR family transcriptional regulator [Nonomuraea sp. K271]TLF83374.1 PadR family transcriptional regulator [Nonomuraea sp. KC401]